MQPVSSSLLTRFLVSKASMAALTPEKEDASVRGELALGLVLSDEDKEADEDEVGESEKDWSEARLWTQRASFCSSLSSAAVSESSMLSRLLLLVSQSSLAVPREGLSESSETRAIEPVPTTCVAFLTRVSKVSVSL